MLPFVWKNLNWEDFVFQGAGAGEPEAAAVRGTEAAKDISRQQRGLMPNTCARGGGGLRGGERDVIVLLILLIMLKQATCYVV